ncbi:MAG: hypothetical protein K6G67_02265 [Lachnospiraceae bacterium]|nr:hypothetical protein [Lachnospiraceae bacterium]
MKKNKKVVSLVCVLCVIASFTMSACEGTEDSNAPAETGTDTAPQSEYDKYIKDTITSLDDNGATPTPAISPNDRVVTTDRTAPPAPSISSMENPDMDDNVIPTKTPYPTATPTADPSQTEDAAKDMEPEGPLTPEEFPTDTCCIYINGESDSAYGTEIVTAINKARKDLGYTEFTNNKGLATCGDRRTREIAANYSHTRPNGQPFYSVAPEYFKAEMLIIDNQKAEDTVDAIIKKDPISRNLIFTNKYTAIGASSFKCNGMKYTVVAFGL